VREYLSDLGFLKEHFMAPHVTSENVDQVMAPLYHKLVEEESMLPPEQRRILPPQSWVCVVLFVYVCVGEREREREREREIERQGQGQGQRQRQRVCSTQDFTICFTILHTKVTC
jgi:hypothetical protein